MSYLNKIQAKKCTSDDLEEILDIEKDITKINKLESLSSSCADMADVLATCGHFVLEQKFKTMSRKFLELSSDLNELCTFARNFVRDDGKI